MAISAMGRFREFVEPIRALPPSSLSIEQLRAFRLEAEGNVEVYYAPFDYITPDAKVMIVGITPGFYQMQLSFEAARDSLQRGGTAEEALYAAERTGCFAGPMRANLASMLDGLGVHNALAIPSTEQLFEEQRPLLHTTSAVRYPVFVNGENYTGHAPLLRKSPLLMRYVKTLLVEELRLVPTALVVPCGRSVSEVLHELAADGLVDERRVLTGFPHPSGANGHRKRIYDGLKAGLCEIVKRWRENCVAS